MWGILLPLGEGLKEFNANYWPPIGFPCKETTCQTRDVGSIPRLGRSPGEGNGNPLQYSCLENPMDRGSWQTLQSMELQRIGYNLVTKQQQHMAFHRGNRAAFWMLPGGSVEGARLIP